MTIWHWNPQVRCYGTVDRKWGDFLFMAHSTLIPAPSFNCVIYTIMLHVWRISWEVQEVDQCAISGPWWRLSNAPQQHGLRINYIITICLNVKYTSHEMKICIKLLPYGEPKVRAEVMNEQNTINREFALWTKVCFCNFFIDWFLPRRMFAKRASFVLEKTVLFSAV